MKKLLSLLVVLMATVVSAFADTTPDYLCFTAEEAGTQVRFERSDNDWTPDATICYQTVIDGTSSEWTDYTYDSYITLTNAGDKVYFKAKSSNDSFCDEYKSIYFWSDKKVAASGNVMSLLDATCQQTSVPEWAFSYLFYQCDKLTAAPELPATSLAKGCYAEMFYDCTSLTEAPKLPATTLAEICYSQMFKGCTSLTKAPDLPAATLAEYCYAEMFKGCSNLKSVSVSFTNWDVERSTYSWLSGVASTGAFICPENLDDTTFGDSYIPTGWDVIHPDYLCFTAEEAGANVGFTMNGTLASTPSLQYSTDGQNWYNYIIGYKVYVRKAGDKVYFKATTTNSTFSEGYTGYLNFTADKKVAASGNVMSLLDETCQQKSVPEYAFAHLFYKCDKLTTAPELPATELAEGCYLDMFSGCTSLTEAPKLPATELAISCYEQMFTGCTSLTKAPNLPATELEDNCYLWMFKGCSNLKSISVSFTGWNNITCTLAWLEGVASTGKFICPDDLEVRTGVSYIPEGWVMKSSGDIADGDIKWDYDCGELTLTCTVSSAYMPDFDDETSAPWSKYNVKRIYIDPKIKGIGKYNFANCKNLTKMYIGEQMVSIYEHAFEGCTSLDSVFCNHNNTIVDQEAFPSTATFYTNRATGTNWSDYGRTTEATDFLTYRTEHFSLTLDSEDATNCVDNVTTDSNHNLTVGEHSTYNASQLKLNLPVFDDWGRDCKIVALADKAFKGCSVYSVKLPATLQSIGEDAFTGCYALSSISFRSVPSFANTDLSTFGKEGTTFNFTLTDDSYVAANSAVSGVTSATYSRSMANTWGTVVLPFEVKSDETAEYYKIDGIEDGALKVSKYETLPAGTPALVKKLSGDAIAPAATSTAISTALNNISGTVAMTGSYTNDTKVTDANAYYIKDNKFWLNNEYFYIDAFRAYFTNNGSEAKSSVLTIDDMATAINAITGESADVKVEAIYDASGKVRTELGSGLNIVKLSNGKTQKILVK